MNILLVDIETAPNIAYVWGKYEQNVIRYVKQGYMMLFSYKWYGEKKIHTYSLPDFHTYKKDATDDTELVTTLWELFNEADIIIAHNGDRFDIKKSNTYFIKAGLTPPSQYKTVDTLKVARRYFAFNSNKLDDLGEYLGVGRKIETGGFDLWEGCLKGDLKYWKKMIRYNKMDVELLENIHIKLLPWVNNYPNVNAFTGELYRCPNCGSINVHKRGFMIAGFGKRQRYQCVDCGKWSSSAITKEVLKS